MQNTFPHTDPSPKITKNLILKSMDKDTLAELSFPIWTTATIVGTNLLAIPRTYTIHIMRPTTVNATSGTTQIIQLTRPRELIRERR